MFSGFWMAKLVVGEGSGIRYGALGGLCPALESHSGEEPGRVGGRIPLDGQCGELAHQLCEIAHLRAASF